ncbi:cobalt-precorrin-8X methylmutase [Thermosynechococcus sichuanensis E542]|uniref:Cobalt-precorrin-8X methylmutase n=1 Tax=Thermosynechococcus sichuanensis E542 TaxID=2016101 RepID=A0A7D6IZ94_9CYAN|nr:cobalt-precorrin-8X methylmutase [Thermosynechococcus vestitus]QLL29692.1 cobalt-precorrin-8X methylmutase [Thermosynechococcus vestitus E542]
MSLLHPIAQASFAIIDREIGAHPFDAPSYAILRRIIHSTADFEFKNLLEISPGAIAQITQALRSGVPIITDVAMVSVGIQTMASRTFGNPIITALDDGSHTAPGQTRSEAGMIRAWQEWPYGLFVIGNAPTALLALCDRLQQTRVPPAGVIGVPVGFVNVVESKAALAQLPVPQIRIAGRKGGSPVAAAIVNALLELASSEEPV